MNDYRKLYRTRRWRVLRRRVFNRDSWRCQSCGRAGRLECDHIMPMQKGGAFWDMGNLQALCVGCHIAKTASENSHRKRALMPVHRREWRAMVEELTV